MATTRGVFRTGYLHGSDLPSGGGGGGAAILVYLAWVLGLFAARVLANVGIIRRQVYDLANAGVFSISLLVLALLMTLAGRWSPLPLSSAMIALALLSIPSGLYVSRKNNGHPIGEKAGGINLGYTAAATVLVPICYLCWPARLPYSAQDLGVSLLPGAIVALVTILVWHRISALVVAGSIIPYAAKRPSDQRAAQKVLEQPYDDRPWFDFRGRVRGANFAFGYFPITIILGANLLSRIAPHAHGHAYAQARATHEDHPYILAMLAAVMAITDVVLIVRRCNDMGRSPWHAAWIFPIALFPPAGLLIGGVLCAMSGDGNDAVDPSEITAGDLAHARAAAYGREPAPEYGRTPYHD